MELNDLYAAQRVIAELKYEGYLNTEQADEFSIVLGSIELGYLPGLVSRETRYQRVEECPQLRFQVADEMDPGQVVWYALTPTAYGAALTAYRSDPGSQPTLRDALGDVHLDFFDNQLAVQVTDNPSGELHWVTPWGREVADTVPNGASIVLVANVQEWQPPKDEEED